MTHRSKTTVSGICYGMALAALAGACSGTDVHKFNYSDNPGGNLPEGGDVRIEHVFIADGTHQENPDGTGGVTWLQVYQWTSANKATTKALPPEGTCTDLRTGQFWPNSLLNDPSITDIDEGSGVTITGPTGATVLPKCTTATNVGSDGVTTSQCSTTSTPPRALDPMHGGLSAGSPQGSFLANIDPDTVQQNSDYVVDLDGKMTDEGGPISVHVPSRYDTPELGDGSGGMARIGAAPVVVPANADLTLTWTPPDDPSTGTDHTAKTDFGRFFVLDTNASSNQGFPLSWVCIPALVSGDRRGARRLAHGPGLGREPVAEDRWPARPRRADALHGVGRQPPARSRRHLVPRQSVHDRVSEWTVTARRIARAASSFRRRT